MCVSTYPRVIFLTLLLLSGSLFADDDEIVIDIEDEYVVTVSERLVAPLSPSVRVIKASEFQGKFSDLPSVLETVSGVDIRSMGGYGGYAESAIRGGAAMGTRVYLDGVLLNSASSGAVDLGKIPLDRITEIRVTKSASGLRQMGAGMGGVIELFTGEVADKKNVGTNFEAGSFGYYKMGMTVRANTQQFNVDMASSQNDYPYTHDNGTKIPTRRDPDPSWDDTVFNMRNNHYRSIDASHNLSLDIGGAHRINQQISGGAYEQGLFVYHYKNDQSGETGGGTVIYDLDYLGIVSPRLTLGGELSGIYRRNSISDPDGKYSLGGGGKELASSGGSGDILVDARYLLTDRFYLSGLLGTRHENHTQRNRALSDKPEMSRAEYRAGIELSYTTLPTKDAALRVLYKHETDNTTAGLGYWQTEGSQYSIGYPVAEAVARINYHPVTLQLSASASKRSPTFFERLGWGSGFLSNPNLREETRAEADAGASLDMGAWGASASLFGGRVDDKIKSIPQNSFVKVMNFADTRFYGAEADVRARFLRVFTTELSAAYLTSAIVKSEDPSWVGKTEPFVPAFSGFLKTEIDIKKLTVGHGVRYESECYLSVENLEKKDAQYELSAWASYVIKDMLTMRYRVANYLNTANFDFLNNPKPRRTHVVSVGVSL